MNISKERFQLYWKTKYYIKNGLTMIDEFQLYIYFFSMSTNKFANNTQRSQKVLFILKEQ